MVNTMDLSEGKYTAESFAQERGITRASALNLLSRLKKQGRVHVSGGGRQKRIYTVSRKPLVKTHGFYDIVNKYSPEKLVPKFTHVVKGKYTVEHAIIDGIRIGDARTRQATKHLFNHVTNWKRLFDLAKEKGVMKDVQELYNEARSTMKCRAMPRRYR